MGIRLHQSQTKHSGSHGERVSNDKSESNVLTDAEHGPEHGCVLDRGAVPPVVPELPLTFPDAVPGAPAHVDHVVSVEAAQLLLALGQPLDPGNIQDYAQGDLKNIQFFSVQNCQ